MRADRDQSVRLIALEFLSSYFTVMRNSGGTTGSLM